MTVPLKRIKADEQPEKHEKILPWSLTLIYLKKLLSVLNVTSSSSSDTNNDFAFSAKWSPGCFSFNYLFVTCTKFVNISWSQRPE